MELVSIVIEDGSVHEVNMDVAGEMLRLHLEIANLHGVISGINFPSIETPESEGE